MGNRDSRSARNIVSLHEGLNALSNGAQILAENAPSMVECWTQMEGKVQRVEANLVILQHSVGRIEERLDRLEDLFKRSEEREREREKQMNALDLSVQRALASVLPRVEDLLSQLEHSKQVNNTVAQYKVSPCGEGNSSNTIQEPSTSGISSVNNDDGSKSPQKAQRKRRRRAKKPPVDFATESALPRQHVSSSSSSSSYDSPLEEEEVTIDGELLDAAERGNAEAVCRLVAEGANTDAEDGHGKTPLLLAAAAGHVECVSALLDAGANAYCTNGLGFQPIHVAAENGHADVLVALLSYIVIEARVAQGVVVDHRGSTALIIAANCGQLECVRLLLDMGADVNAEDDHGMTALHKAVIENHLQCVDVLLHYGADTDLTDQRGRAPLDYAFLYHMKQVKDILLRSGARRFCNRR